MEESKSDMDVLKHINVRVRTKAEMKELPVGLHIFEPGQSYPNDWVSYEKVWQDCIDALKSRTADGLALGIVSEGDNDCVKDPTGFEYESKIEKVNPANILEASLNMKDCVDESNASYKGERVKRESRFLLSSPCKKLKTTLEELGDKARDGSAKASAKLYRRSVCGHQASNKDDAGRHSLAHTGKGLVTYSDSESNEESQDVLQYHETISTEDLVSSHNSEELTEISGAMDMSIQGAMDGDIQGAMDGDIQGVMSEVIRDAMNKVIQLKFICSICSYETRERSRAKRHSLTHSDIRLFKCSECRFDTNRKENLRMHLGKVHGIESFEDSSYRILSKKQIASRREVSFQTMTQVSVNVFTCSLCEYRTEDKSAADTHELIHPETRIEVHKCRDCEFTTDCSDTLHVHLLDHQRLFKTIKKEDVDQNDWRHFISEFTRTTYKCSFCSYETRGRAHAKRHSLTHSGDQKLFKCTRCQFSSNRKDKMQKHLQKIHKIEISEDLDHEYATTQDLDAVIEDAFNQMITEATENLYSCSLCDFETVKESVAEKHVLMHTDAKLDVYKCYDCEFEADCNSKLKYHVLKHHETSMMDKLDWDNQVLKRRIKNSGIKSCHSVIKCAFCDYKTLNSSHAKRHQLTHSDVKLFQCSQCDYECNRKDKMKLHELRHSDAKFFKCSICSYDCVDQVKLKAHELRHSSGERLFKCPLCDYESNRKYNTKLHILRHGKRTRNSFKTSRRIFIKSKLKEHAREVKSNCLKDVKVKSNLSSQPDVDPPVQLHSHFNNNDIYFYQCSTCDYFTDRKAKFHVHMDCHHKRKSSSVDEMKSPESQKAIIKSGSGCDQSKSASKKLNPKKRVRKNLLRYPKCGFRINRQGQLKSHSVSLPSTSRLLDSNKTCKDTKKSLICPSCPYRAKKEKTMQQHILIHLKYSQCNSTSTSVLQDELQDLNVKEELQGLDVKEELQNLDVKEELQDLNVKEELQNLDVKEELQDVEVKEELQDPLLQHSIFKVLKCHECGYVTTFLGCLQLHKLNHRKGNGDSDVKNTVDHMGHSSVPDDLKVKEEDDDEEEEEEEDGFNIKQEPIICIKEEPSEEEESMA